MAYLTTSHVKQGMFNWKNMLRQATRRTRKILIVAGLLPEFDGTDLVKRRGISTMVHRLNRAFSEQRVRPDDSFMHKLLSMQRIVSREKFTIMVLSYVNELYVPCANVRD